MQYTHNVLVPGSSPGGPTKFMSENFSLLDEKVFDIIEKISKEIQNIINQKSYLREKTVKIIDESV